MQVDFIVKILQIYSANKIRMDTHESRKTLSP